MTGKAPLVEFTDKDTIHDDTNESPQEQDARVRAHTKSSQKVLRSEIDGEIISYLEACKILHKKYKASGKSLECMLLGVRAFSRKEPDKDGYLTMVHCPDTFSLNILRANETRFYAQSEVDSLIPEPYDIFLTFEQIMERKTFKDFDEVAIINLLKQINTDKDLMVFDPDHHYPGVMVEEKYNPGHEGWQSTGFYGEEAQQLIVNRQALFRLDELITIEENYFSKKKTKSAPPKNPTEQIVEMLFKEALIRIENKTKKHPTSKERMAEKILQEGNKRKLFLRELNTKTIERILSDLKYRERVNEAKLVSKNKNL